MALRWNLRALPSLDALEKICGDLGISRELGILLLQRGLHDFETARRYFTPEETPLHDPFAMADMSKAVDRLEQARQQGERIMVFGDYDVDGTTSVALVADCLQQLDLPFCTYIPDRYAEGYGLSDAGMHQAQAWGCSLVIALDCGIKGHPQVALANSLGLDMIICDHHQPGPTLPPAHAVLDPKRADCAYPFKELSGCGVGFKLMQAWYQRMGKADETLWPLLDLLAVSIAADIVPMVGENRVLMARGLQLINEKPRTGLRALMAFSAQKERLTTEDVVFQIAPRINAAGRIEHGKLAVELLTTRSADRAAELAEHINQLNSERKGHDETIAEEALELLQGTASQFTSVVYQPHWHKGVIGIAASRLIETHYRPTVVLTRSGDVLAGSARSVHGFDLYTAIDACREHLIQFGGHAFAAGMTLRPEQLEGFKQAFEQSVRERIREEQRHPHITIDLRIEADKLTRRFYNSLLRMGPFGPQNLMPVLACFQLKDRGYSRTVGTDHKHLKVSLVDRNGIALEGIAFGMASALPMLQNGWVDVAFTLDLNVWNGKERLQLNVKAIRPSIE
jgi:single-stranded-DNA-specific exonuclease